uniref:Uncharacterized protein n=1 Tax=viral metagenome TaxID=1070528 RepID=A0A6C0IY85_9ZZZZ
MSIQGIFIFEISGWDGQTLPIINSDNSFNKLDSSKQGNQVTVQFSFTDNGTTDDGLNFYQTGFSEKNVTIVQWGGIPLSRNSFIPQYQIGAGRDEAKNQLSYNGIFRKFNGKIVTKDTPMILNNTNLQSCFLSVVIESKDYGNIGDWDTSGVNSMSLMFNAWNGTKLVKYNFNQPIGDWDTSNVRSMYAMFGGASKFNQPIGDWDTQNVTTMSSMFYLASQFNQPIGNWNTSKVTDMSFMFNAWDGTKYLEYNFNQPIGDWDTSKVTTMKWMFSGASKFNQPIGDWDTSKVTTMRGMFYLASQFNQPIGDWDTQNVTDMEGMFNAFDVSTKKYIESNFNQPIADWNTSKVTTMKAMFEGASRFESDIRRWTVRKSTNLEIMFREAKRFKRKYRVGDTPRYTFFNQNQRNQLTTIQKFLIISGI